jgi:hypothetical protein
LAKAPPKAKSTKATARRGGAAASPRGRARAAGDRFVVFIEVLQNGASMARTERAFGRHGSLELTSDERGPLALPFYPLPGGRLEVLRTDSHGTHLIVDHRWEGFGTSKGKLANIHRGDKGRSELPLYPGDYASVGCDDLRLMVRIAKRATVVEDGRIGLDPAYRESPLAFLARTPSEWRTLGAAIAATLVILGGLVGGLWKRPYAKAERLNDIPESYLLSFVGPPHLKTGPEALQGNLDRRVFARSVLESYQAFTAVMMGWRGYEARYLQPTTIVRYAALYDEARGTAEQFLGRQRQVDDQQMVKDDAGLLAIPTVVGESVGGSMLRIIDKIDVAQSSFQETLAAKRALIDTFPKDKPYDYEDYKNVQLRDDRAAILAQIKPWGRETDEQMMYAEADRLAKTAGRRRARIDRAVGAREPLDPDGRGPVGMPLGTAFASFVPDHDLSGADDKLYRLQATEWGAKPVRKAAPKEPLVGEIEPGLIERYIKQNRFQLQLCYELALRRNELAAGTMEWRWRIDSRGLISDVALVSSSIRDQRMVQCVRDKISAWRFPRPRRGSVEISYPFEFAPSKG